MKIYRFPMNENLTLCLRFDMAAWERLEDELCLLDELADKLTQRGRIPTLAHALAILSGEDQQAIRAALQPWMVRKLIETLWKCINDGLSMQQQLEGADQVIDVTLLEIEKKEERGG